MPSPSFAAQLEIAPDSSLVHTNLGMALSRQGRFDEAREHFRRALEIDPRDARAHRELGYLLLRDRKIDDARAQFQRAVELDPRDVVARGNLGAVLFEQGKTDEAITAFQAALAIDPKYLPGHVDLARALAARGNINEAIAQCRLVLSSIRTTRPPARSSTSCSAAMSDRRPESSRCPRQQPQGCPILGRRTISRPFDGRGVAGVQKGCSAVALREPRCGFG